MRGASGSARAALLTVEGRGAISVIRVWGPDALRVTDAVFRPAIGGPLSASPPGTPRFGRAGLGLGDEVVALVVPGKPPECEIQGHAGRAAVAAILQALEAAGAELRNPSAWVRATAGSLVAAEAHVDLARAPTARAAEILLEQAQGALDRAFEALAGELASDPEAAAVRVGRLIDLAAIGLHLADGWRVAIVGRPNVGKSRLLNALGGFDRAIVDPTPGTTCDVVALTTAFDGWPVELRDTAGLRATGDEVERAGIGAG
ncbi:MAG: 50S ribosome-binding GTPase, partial [Thermoleophilia bacterium]|nr:50S ribosome-binding GTPase [Thermoleophilia bacterium]